MILTRFKIFFFQISWLEPVFSMLDRVHCRFSHALHLLTRQVSLTDSIIYYLGCRLLLLKQLWLKNVTDYLRKIKNLFWWCIKFSSPKNPKHLLYDTFQLNGNCGWCSIFWPEKFLANPNVTFSKIIEKKSLK